MSEPWHFGDPCIHCGTAHDAVSVGPCVGDEAKAIPIAFNELPIRWDGTRHYIIRMSTGRVRELYQHGSMGGPYTHFALEGWAPERQPPRHDPKLTIADVSA